MSEKKTPLGRLRELLTVQQDAPTNDGQGGRSLAPATIGTVYAEVRAVQRAGMEQSTAGALRAIAAYDVECVYRPDITPKRTRLLWTPYGGGEKTLEVIAVSPFGADRLLLQCAEVA